MTEGERQPQRQDPGPDEYGVRGRAQIEGDEIVARLEVTPEDVQGLRQPERQRGDDQQAQAGQQRQDQEPLPPADAAQLDRQPQPEQDDERQLPPPPREPARGAQDEGQPREQAPAQVHRAEGGDQGRQDEQRRRDEEQRRQREEAMREAQDDQEQQDGGLLSRLWPFGGDRDQRRQEQRRRRQEYPRVEQDRLEQPQQPQRQDQQRQGQEQGRQDQQREPQAEGQREQEGQRRERRRGVIPQTEIGQDLAAAIEHQALISDARYEQAIEKERDARKEILNGMKSLGKNAIKIAIPLVGAYFGYHLVAGHSFETAISNIPDTSGEIKALFGKAKDAVASVVGDLINRGQEIERGFFDYNAVNPEKGGWFQRATLKFGNVLDALGIYNDPEKLSTGVTKVIGTPFAAIFGEGSIFHKDSVAIGDATEVLVQETGKVVEKTFVDSTTEGYPNAGTWTSPVLKGLGVLTGAWAFHKAASILARKRDQWTAVSKLKHEESKGLKAREKSYRLLGRDQEAQEARLVRKNLDERVQSIREKEEARRVRERAGIREQQRQDNDNNG